MNTKNIATSNPKAIQWFRKLTYALIISAALISQWCKDTRTWPQIRVDNYAERVITRDNIEADLQNYKNKLEQAQAELIAIQAQIQTTKRTIQNWNHTKANAKQLKKLKNQEVKLQNKIGEYLISIQTTQTKLNAAQLTLETLSKSL